MPTRAGRTEYVEFSDLLTRAEWDYLEEVRRAGAHGSMRATVREAIWIYALHFSRQGLIDAPPVDFFRLTGGKRRS